MQRSLFPRTRRNFLRNAIIIRPKVSISIRGSNGNIVSMGSSKTNPTVQIQGGDELYGELNGYNLNAGRSLNDLDIQSGRNVCVLGNDLVKKFFNDHPESALEKIVKINGIPFRIIGTMESKGSSIGRSWDNVVITSYNTVRRFFLTQAPSPYNPAPSFYYTGKNTRRKTDGSCHW